MPRLMYYSGTESESDKDIKDLNNILGKYDDKQEYDKYINLLKTFVPDCITIIINKMMKIISWKN